MRPLYPLPALALLLASCDPGPLPESGLAAASSSYHQALLVMLDCRNQFGTAMTTLSRSAPHMTAQQKLEVVLAAYEDRVNCERRITPILDQLRAGTAP